MKQRLLVAGLGVPALLLLLLACPAWATLLLVCGIAGVAAYELLHTAGKNVPYVVYGMTVLVAVLQEIYIFTGSDAFAVGTISSVTVMRWYFVMLLFLFAVVAYGREGREICFSDVATALVGGMVFPALYSCIFLLRMEENGRVFVLMPFVIAFIGDTFSMLAGMWFGKNSKKMAPHVSPKKTWVGGLAGPVGSVLGMLLLGVIAKAAWGYEASYLMLALTAAAANVLGQLGDLSMSLIKREAGIKDYSHLFLTHGGMLDRFDSTMFIAPVVYFFVAGGLL